MEIKNLNFFNANNAVSVEGPKKKKLHKKTISALNSPHHNALSPVNAHANKVSQKENLKQGKKTKHCKAKSQ